MKLDHISRIVMAAAVTGAGALVMGCTESTSGPSSPVGVVGPAPSTHSDHGNAGTTPADHHSAAHTDKGDIKGWFDGRQVSLYYTKWFFCAEPPQSAADTNCVLGAAPEVAPRPGPIRTIYALAPVGFTPDPSTLACFAGTPCLNHPGMIDASRIGLPARAPAAPHSHILDERGGGWRKTVNIRVFNLAAWNQIAEAKTLAKVRELQGDPAVGRPGVISADTPTNIFFFIASWQDER